MVGRGQHAGTARHLTSPKSSEPHRALKPDLSVRGLQLAVNDAVLVWGFIPRAIYRVRSRGPVRSTAVHDGPGPPPVHD